MLNSVSEMLTHGYIQVAYTVNQLPITIEFKFSISKNAKEIVKRFHFLAHTDTKHNLNGNWQLINSVGNSAFFVA